MCDSEILYDRCRSTRTTSAAVKIVAVVLSGQVALNKQECRPTARSRANRQPAIALLLKRVALITCYNLDGFNYWLDQQKQHYAGSSNFFFSLFAFVARGPQQSHPSAVFFLLSVCVLRSLHIQAKFIETLINSHFIRCTYLNPLSSSIPFMPFAGADSSFFIFPLSYDGFSLSLSSIVYGHGKCHSIYSIWSEDLLKKCQSEHLPCRFRQILIRWSGTQWLTMDFPCWSANRLEHIRPFWSQDLRLNLVGCGIYGKIK